MVGFDNERHAYGEARYPGQLVIQDVLTLHGSQFKDAALIVASPPCQAYSYRAMPWKRAKALPPPDNALFEACFRIQREAEHAAGHAIPLVVENVCGAQKWVGRARWHYGSFYLWGDVPALMPITRRAKVGGFRFDGSGGSFQTAATKVPGLNWSGSDKPGYKAQAFNSTAEQRLKATKNDGGSWFAVAHNTTSGHSQNPDGRKSSGGGKDGWFGDYAAMKEQGRKGYASGTGNLGKSVISRLSSSGSTARKAASAHIAKIPLELARHIARAWKPTHCEVA